MYGAFYSSITLPLTAPAHRPCRDGSHCHAPCPTLRLQHRHDEVVLGHEVVLCDERGEPAAEMRLVLKAVKDGSMVEVGVTEDTVDAAADAAKFCHGRFFNAHPGKKVNWSMQSFCGRSINRHDITTGPKCVLYAVVGSKYLKCITNSSSFIMYQNKTLL